ncbi:peptidase, S9A/B/C family, catalytic domain protein [Ancylostoma ceylanicum]|uniref:Peptidase, S9A/B/C family, catalytic domain protein n=1 Tax=Ancylostoma ceylanicum TaxID=53326 RepID=A0A0D6L5H0_9BILA|nr:peptidase, S9A/B/C family, catalytic domain protein [Ancylostoma ceylanicum]
MAPLERSPTPNVPWHQLVAHARLLRAELRSSLALPFSRMSIVATKTGCRLYALGTPVCSSNQTVLSAEIPTDGGSSNIVLEPMFSPDQFKAATPSVEFSLMCERQRATVVSGVTDYMVDSDGSNLMLTTGEQIHIEREGSLLYRTSSTDPNISNGVPAFIIQEELDRFQAVWWSPTTTRLLYERVDETAVRSLMFVCPGREAPAPMKYPVAGTENHTSQLRLIIIDGNTVLDCGLKVPLKMRYPWVEYIARAGFLNDGKTIWVQIMNRTQSQAALVILPESEFEGINSSGPIREPSVVKDEVSTAWINNHNAIIPLDGNPSTIEFIYASEQSSHCHLNEVADLRERVVTQGDFSVCKATSVVIDKDRRLVYYIANVATPTEWSVGERACHHLCLLPSNGFACWMTSLSQPPQCRYYSLVFSEDSILPNATLVAQIGLSGYNLPATVQINDIPVIVEYQSRNMRRYAMVMRPTNFEAGRSYPVLHYVYGGPGIQLVRNDYSTWIPFQKYTKLGFVVVMLDGRGSSNRGTEFEFPIFGKLGQCEVEDQVEGLQEVAQIMDGMLDLSRVVVQGWSYGGYMSLLALAKYPHVFRAAIAGGAVTDWKLYDTAYTERYLGYGSERDPFYEESSVIKHVEKLPDQPGRLLLVHGLLDENVHFRHTEALIEQLIKAGKPYQLQLFPSERHGIRSSDGAAHLDASMLNFIQQALKD